MCSMVTHFLTHRNAYGRDVIISCHLVILVIKFNKMFDYWDILVFQAIVNLSPFYILGNTNNVKLVHARIRRSHGSDAEDDHLFALLHRSVWHQQIPTFSFCGSSKHVSLYPGVRKQDFSKTCWVFLLYRFWHPVCKWQSFLTTFETYCVSVT